MLQTFVWLKSESRRSVKSVLKCLVTVTDTFSISGIKISVMTHLLLLMAASNRLIFSLPPMNKSIPPTLICQPIENLLCITLETHFKIRASLLEFWILSVREKDISFYFDTCVYYARKSFRNVQCRLRIDVQQQWQLPVGSRR